MPAARRRQTLEVINQLTRLSEREPLQLGTDDVSRLLVGIDTETVRDRVDGSPLGVGRGNAAAPAVAIPIFSRSGPSTIFTMTCRVRTAVFLRIVCLRNFVSLTIKSDASLIKHA